MPRNERVLLALVFGLHCAATIAGAITHEPWWDEAQSWLIARDAPLGELFSHVLRYEGHPPLWYLLLAIPARLGLPYWWLKVIGVLGGATSAFLLLFGFPRVPVFIRILAPFSLFVAYQYTVVARSYVLILPLLLLIARMYERRHEHPGRFALLLVLLSHVSVHGFAIACGLAALFLADIWRRRIPAPPRRALIPAAAAFVVSSLLLIALLWPPPVAPSTAAHLHSPFQLQRHSQIVTSIVTPMFFPPWSEETPAEAVSFVIVALVALTILIAWFFRSGSGAAFTIPALAAYTIFLRHYAPWHEGIVFALILFAAFIAFGRRGPERRGLLGVAAQLVLILLLARHAQWTFQSLSYDLTSDATGSRRAAEFIRRQGLDRRQLFGAGGGVVEIQPYFDSNVFGNFGSRNRAYWEYSPRNPWPYAQFTPGSREQMERWFGELLRVQPEFIVYAGGNLEDELYAPRLFRNPSYRRVASFGGSTFWKDEPQRLQSFHVFQRADLAAAARLNPP
jgi:hypothetical protein